MDNNIKNLLEGVLNNKDFQALKAKLSQEHLQVIDSATENIKKARNVGEYSELLKQELDKIKDAYRNSTNIK